MNQRSWLITCSIFIVSLLIGACVELPESKRAPVRVQAPMRPEDSAPLWRRYSGTLSRLVTQVPVMGIQSYSYVAPTLDEQQLARSAFDAIINQQYVVAFHKFKRLGFEISELHDAATTYILVQEAPSGPLRGWGFFAINMNPKRLWTIAAPHPSNDQFTELQAAELVEDLSAWALLMSTSFRCAITEPSRCSGYTRACGQKQTRIRFPLSDMAHTEQSIFHVAHKAFFEANNATFAIQIHGFERHPGRRFHYVISDGTEFPSLPDSPSNQMVALLRGQLKKRSMVVPCNGRKRDSLLCGTTNVQGRQANGSPNPCRRRAKTSTHRFLHIEQSMQARSSYEEIGPHILKTALRELTLDQNSTE